MEKSRFSTFFRDKKALPPYFGGEFNCYECDGKCTKACVYELLVFNGSEVEILIKNVGCKFCPDCVNACDRGVLSLKFDKKIGAKTTISVQNCLAWNNTVCYTCSDVCSYNAIDFFYGFRPVINEKCLNCAECVPSCPLNAICFKGIY